jgi:putative transposase
MSTGVYNKFTGYHNRKSMRLREYDYSRPGSYFITICIHDRTRKLFGDVIDNVMVLNDAGIFAQQCLLDIPRHFPCATVQQNIVMPNHVHAIITIHHDDRVQNAGVQNVGVQNVGVQNVGVQNLEPLHFEPRRVVDTKRNEYQHIIPGSIGSIVRGFKIGVTKWFRKTTPGMIVWQRGYYDHIIRDNTSLYFIGKYIHENPSRWIDDKENHINREINEFEMVEG